MIPGASLIFKFRLVNNDGTLAKHSDFLDLIVYVYIHSNKIVKFSKSDKYSPLVLLNENELRVDLSPEQTRFLGTGRPFFSIYAAVAATGFPDGRLVLKGRGQLLDTPLEADPISDEE